MVCRLCSNVARSPSGKAFKLNGRISFDSLASFISLVALEFVRPDEENIMRTVDRIREVVPPLLNPHDKELVRAEQRCIMASLDHSRAASSTVTTDTGETPTVEVPPVALK